MIWREVITELSVMKIYLNSHKQRLGVTSLSAARRASYRLARSVRLAAIRLASGLNRLQYKHSSTHSHLFTILVN